MNLFGQLGLESAKESDVREMHGAIRTFWRGLQVRALLKIFLFFMEEVLILKMFCPLLTQENVDGILVGGASVSMETFGKLLEKLPGKTQ